MSDFLNQKFKVKFNFRLTKSFNSLTGEIIFKENHFVIKLKDNNSKNKGTLINFLNPVYTDNDELYFSYGLIFKIDNINNVIKLDMFHPSNQEMMIIEINEFLKPGLFFDKKLSPIELVNIKNFLQIKKNQMIKYLIETLVLFFNCLKNGVNRENIVSNLEDKYYHSINESKKYFNNAVNDLKKSDKLKINVKKKIVSKEKLYGKFEESKVNDTTLYSVSMTKPTSKNNEISTKTLIDEIWVEKRQIKYLSFESLFYEIKRISIQSLQSSIDLLFQIIEFDNFYVNLKNINKRSVSKNLKMINLEENSVKKQRSSLNAKDNSSPKVQNEIETDHMRYNEINKNRTILKNNDSLTKTRINPDFDQKNVNNHFIKEEHKVENEGNVVLMSLEESNNLHCLLKTLEENQKVKVRKNGGETPKFIEKYKVKLENKSNNLEIYNVSLMELDKIIDESKKNHRLVTPNEFSFIIHNTSELCHRKFFELCFEEYFNKIFMIERDNLGIIKFDCIISFFYYIKKLKNFLFTDENKIIYSNLMFND